MTGWVVDAPLTIFLLLLLLLLIFFRFLIAAITRARLTFETELAAVGARENRSRCSLDHGRDGARRT